ncbi:MAG: 2-octaprenyl-6-methoxyphenyl hydroxylase [Steroidobacteraceae bacterium]
MSASSTPRGGDHYDVVIVGGGLVGASLALALAPTRRRVALIEAVLPGAVSQPSFDDRTSALGNGSRRILETLGAWPRIGPQAAAIRTIQVSDAGHFGAARLDATEQGIEALGYTVSNRSIGAGLWGALQAAPGGVQVIAPARVQSVQLAAQGAEVRYSDAAGQDRMLRADLAVAADGAHSLVRAAAGIGAHDVDYEQVAIVANLSADRPAAGIAYERFTTTGPLAVLPLADGSYTVVWTLAPAHAEAVLAHDDAAFLAELQTCFGWRIGTIRRVGKRASYPLLLTRAQSAAGVRSVLVGNASQALHPVAGQGFNLGLRDAAVLAELVAEADDAGTPVLLERFAALRARDRAGMVQFTDALVRGFASRKPGAALLRNLGLLAFDAAPFAKSALASLSWGFGDHTPRLMRGLPLASGPDAAAAGQNAP